MNYRDKRSDSERSRRQKGDSRSTKSGIFLTGRQVSLMVSSGVMLSFCVFITGYFLGKKKAVEKFYSKIDQDSFADQIYYSMCSMYDKGGFKGADSQGSSLENNNVCIENDAHAPLVAAETVIQPAFTDHDLPKDGALVAQKNDKKDVQESKVEGQFYAKLIGFGAKRSAQRFANKLTNQGLTVFVKNRRSKTARGRVIVWYQVVTGTFGDKNDLIALVDDISAQEKLKDVRIVSC